MSKCNSNGTRAGVLARKRNERAVRRTFGVLKPIQSAEVAHKVRKTRTSAVIVMKTDPTAALANN